MNFIRDKTSVTITTTGNVRVTLTTMRFSRELIVFFLN